MASLAVFSSSTSIDEIEIAAFPLDSITFSIYP